MSTEITRAMTKAHPLGPDDVAAISMLYPASGWYEAFGSIAGQVTLGGQGVNLASVVALTTTGEAISTLTNPDGTYELSGLPPGAYQVYVHPVPPSLPSELLQPVNLVLPTDSEGAIALSPAFNTIFQSGTASPGDPIQVAAGKNVDGVNFSVTQRDNVGIYDVQTYSYFWNNAAQAYDTLKPATLLLGDTNAPYAVVAGKGLLAGNGKDPIPGLSVSVLGAPEVIRRRRDQGVSIFAGLSPVQSRPQLANRTGAAALGFQLERRDGNLTRGVLLSATAPPSISALQQNAMAL